jgi:hypothetical protein
MTNLGFSELCSSSSEQDHVVVLTGALAPLLDELLHGTASSIQAKHHALVVVPQ